MSRRRDCQCTGHRGCVHTGPCPTPAAHQRHCRRCHTLRALAAARGVETLRNRTPQTELSHYERSTL
jgi:hypothetical protein